MEESPLSDVLGGVEEEWCEGMSPVSPLTTTTEESCCSTRTDFGGDSSCDLDTLCVFLRPASPGQTYRSCRSLRAKTAVQPGATTSYPLPTRILFSRNFSFTPALQLLVCWNCRLSAYDEEFAAAGDAAAAASAAASCHQKSGGRKAAGAFRVDDHQVMHFAHSWQEVLVIVREFPAERPSLIIYVDPQDFDSSPPPATAAYSQFDAVIFSDAAAYEQMMRSQLSRSCLIGDLLQGKDERCLLCDKVAPLPLLVCEDPSISREFSNLDTIRSPPHHPVLRLPPPTTTSLNTAARRSTIAAPTTTATSSLNTPSTTPLSPNKPDPSPSPRPQIAESSWPIPISSNSPRSGALHFQKSSSTPGSHKRKNRRQKHGRKNKMDQSADGGLSRRGKVCFDEEVVYGRSNNNNYGGDGRMGSRLAQGQQYTTTLNGISRALSSNKFADPAIVSLGGLRLLY